MSVESFARHAQVRPGKTISYAIWVWSTRQDGADVAVRLAVKAETGVKSPRFTVCPRAKRNGCAVGRLPRGFADELQATVRLRKSAVPGGQVVLTARATAKGSRPYSVTRTVTVTAGPLPSVSPAPTLPPVVPTLPPIIQGAGPSNPSGLFPTVSPASTATPSAGSSTSPPTGTGHGHRVSATIVSDTVPLNPRLIGGQLVGLAVLAGAIVAAIARFSLRSRRPQGEGGSQKS